MPLQSQFIEMPLIKGLDTKTDPKQVPLGKLLEAENVVYNRPGRIEKRNGFSVFPQTIIDTGNNINVGRAIDNYKEELIAFDTANFYSYVEGTDKWKDKGDFVSSYITANPVTNGTAVDSSPNTAYHSSGLTCNLFISNDGITTGLYYSIIDVVNGQTIISRKLIANNATKARVITFNNVFVIYYINTSNNRIYLGTLPVGNIGATIAFNFITGTGISDNALEVGANYDVAVIESNIGKNIYLVFGNSDVGNPRITLRKYTTPDATPTQVVFDNLDPSNPNTLPDNFSLTHERSYDAILLSTILNNIGLDFYVISPAIVDGSGNVNIILDLFHSQSENFYNVNCISKTFAIGDPLEASVYFSYQDGPLGAEYDVVSHATLTEVAGNLVFTANSTNLYNATLVSSCFLYDNNTYIVVSGAPTNQTTYFLIDQNYNIIGRFDQEISLQNFGLLSTINKIDDVNYIFSTRIVAQYSQIGGTTLTGIRLTNINLFNPEKSYGSDELADNLYVGGGMLFAYDGISLVEDNFCYYPSGSATPNSGSGAFSYAYRFTYEWIDNWGNVHVSTPSDDVRVTIANPIGVSGSAVDLEITTQTLTYKKPSLGRNPIIIAAYRTKTGESEFYKLPVTNANVNDTSVFSILLVDTTTDADLISGAPLYTNGSPTPLEAQPSPPVGALVSHKNRLFVLDSTNPLTIYYSNEYSEDTPPAFNLAATIQVDPFGGPVTGLASMDDKLIIFKENSIRYLVGQGPNNTGADNDYQGTTLITSDCGCSNTRSIVNTPDGLMFKSNKGIMLLNRGLQVGYIGNAVEKYNSANVTSAVLTTKLNQVRLTLDTGITLVYDYFIDVWSVFTNINAVDSVIWNNQHTYIRSNGQVLQETEGSYVDGSSAIPMKISTTWLQLSGIQGFQRLWKFYILGNWKSSHQLKVQLSYDYNDAYSQEIIVNPTPLSTYGTGNYGSESPYGGEFALYQYEVRPSRQKCMTMKVVISDIPSGSVALGASCDISNLRFEYGVEGKGNRLRDANIAG